MVEGRGAPMQKGIQSGKVEESCLAYRHEGVGAEQGNDAAHGARHPLNSCIGRHGRLVGTAPWLQVSISHLQGHQNEMMVCCRMGSQMVSWHQMKTCTSSIDPFHTNGCRGKCRVTGLARKKVQTQNKSKCC